MSEDSHQGELSSLRRRAARSVWGRLGSAPAPEPAPKPPPARNGHAPVNGHTVNGHHPPPEIEVQFNLLPDAPPIPKPAKKRAPPLAPDGVSAITEDAIAAYNAILAMPHGVLSKVTHIGIENRRKEVARSIAMARRMCEQLYGDPTVTRRFWEQYFGEVDKDDFKSGRMMGGNGHDTWRPGFEYLTRPTIMLTVFENAVSG